MKVSTFIFLLSLVIGGTTVYHGIGIESIKSDIDQIQNNLLTYQETPDFSKRELMLAEILKQKISSENIVVSDANQKGNALLLYSENFGDLLDAYEFKKILTTYIPDIEVKSVKKKNWILSDDEHFSLLPQYLIPLKEQDDSLRYLIYIGNSKTVFTEDEIYELNKSYNSISIFDSNTGILANTSIPKPKCKNCVKEYIDGFNVNLKIGEPLPFGRMKVRMFSNIKDFN